MPVSHAYVADDDGVLFRDESALLRKHKVLYAYIAQNLVFGGSKVVNGAAVIAELLFVFPHFFAGFAVIFIGYFVAENDL